MMDVFAGFDSASDHVLNVYDMNIVATGATFFQGTSLAERRWSPGAGSATSESLDSFVTLGEATDAGTTYAAFATAADPSFSNYNTNYATTIAANAGWYNSNPLSTEGDAVLLSADPAFARFGAESTHGVWVAHFVFNTAAVETGASVAFSGGIGFKNPTTAGAQLTTGTANFVIPAPGALALLAAVAGTRSRKRCS
ncbi:MAG: hypothetical protein WCO75_08695 [Planctomycetota bacterium]